MDDLQARTLKNLRDHHQKKIRQAAEGIQEHIGYVLARLDTDASGSTVGHYATGIAADAQEIVRRLALLEGIGGAAGILESADEPAKE